MAKVFKAPTPPPPFVTNYPDMQKAEEAYIADLKAKAKLNNPKSKIVGEIVRFQRADGYAQYMVWNERPLELIWLELGDAWQIEEFAMRGLNLKDIKQRIEHSKAMAALFAKK